MTTEVVPILLESDDYSPNSSPHSLPALHWPWLFLSALESIGADGIEVHLKSKKWSPQWRYAMYKQAHYHSTTHELLIVIRSSARVLLCGTDDRAHPKNTAPPSSSFTQIQLQEGDALLLPAGYAHRMLEGDSTFTMIGSYPSGSSHWDMRFPNINGCVHDVKKIKSMVNSLPRKELFNACSPELVLQSHISVGQMEEHWSL